MNQILGYAISGLWISKYRDCEYHSFGASLNSEGFYIIPAGLYSLTCHEFLYRVNNATE